MNIEILHSFIVLAETLNYRVAAEMLYISQSALSHQINELERNIGKNVFERTTRNVTLTPAGKICLDHAVQIMDNWGRMKNCAYCEKADQSLRIGIFGANTTYYISSILSKFKTIFPEVTISSRYGSVNELRSMLINDEIDMLCILLPCISDIEELEYRVLCEETPSIWISESHPFADRSSITLRELENTPIILHSPLKSPHMFSAMMKLCAKNSYTPNIVAYEDNDNLLALRIATGEAVGFIPTDKSVRIPDMQITNTPPGTVIIPIDCDNEPFSRVISWKKGTDNIYCNKLVSLFDCN